MRVMVVGLGSMGKRRIRLLRQFYPDVEIVGVDARDTRRDETVELFSVNCFASMDDAIGAFSPDVGFVSSPPLSHAALIGAMLNAGLHVFSEINLTADGYKENIALASKKKKTLFLSSTPMYRKEIEYITDRVRGKDKLRYRYHVGQYLPDWHPWENYKDFFVGDRRTNGVRELFAIEFPWIFDAFGQIAAFSADPGRLTALEIDYPDCYALTFTHKNGVVGQLMFDIVSRKAIRDFELFGESLYLRWGGTPSSLYDYDIEQKTERQIECYKDVMRDPRYADNIVENAYVAEIDAFFAAIGGDDGVSRHSFEKDEPLLALMDAIEGGGA